MPICKLQSPEEPYSEIHQKGLQCYLLSWSQYSLIADMNMWQSKSSKVKRWYNKKLSFVFVLKFQSIKKHPGVNFSYTGFQPTLAQLHII